MVVESIINYSQLSVCVCVWCMLTVTRDTTIHSEGAIVREHERAVESKGSFSLAIL